MGATLDPVTGEFNWTPSEAHGPASYTVTVRVSDDGAPSLEDSETFEIVATNKLDDKIDASPVALGGDLFIRGHKYLYCISDS